MSKMSLMSVLPMTVATTYFWWQLLLLSQLHHQGLHLVMHQTIGLMGYIGPQILTLTPTLVNLSVKLIVR